MPRPRRPNAYAQRINRVIDYVYDHADGELSLDTLARVACFSPFHFHRVFTSVVGETVNEFVRRVRMERAVALMKAAPERAVTRIALEAGFSSLSEFSRSFKQRYGMPPGRWDRQSALQDSKNRQADDPCRRYSVAELASVADRGEFTVVVRRLPAMRVAFIRVVDAYNVGNVLQGYARLIGWLNERFGALPAGTLLGMSHDDPDVTPPQQCRYDFCYTVAPGERGAGEIGVRTMPACRVASVHIAGDVAALTRGWDHLYRYWLPRSRWQPANLPAMEIYRRTPVEVGWEYFDLDGCVPIEPL